MAVLTGYFCKDCAILVAQAIPCNREAANDICRPELKTCTIGEDTVVNSRVQDMRLVERSQANTNTQSSGL